jgi:hypothetical protein
MSSHTTYSTEAGLAYLSSARLDAHLDASRAVNSSVRNVQRGAMTDNADKLNETFENYLGAHSSLNIHDLVCCLAEVMGFYSEKGSCQQSE